MKWLALFYLIFLTISLVIEPALFGKARDPYNFPSWVAKLITNAPVFYIYYWVIVHA